MAGTTDGITVSSSTSNVDNYQLPTKPITQEEIKNRLQAILVDPSNKVCADCPALNPNQISLLQKKLVDKTDGNFLRVGVFCCDECSKSHRKLGADICVVKRLFDEFTLEEIQSLEQSGNDFVSVLLEATAFQGEKTTRPRDIFIQEKYKHQTYFSQEKLHQQLVLRQKAARYASLLKKQEPSNNPRASGRLLKRTGSVPNLFSMVNNFKMDDPSLAATTKNNSDHDRATTPPATTTTTNVPPGSTSTDLKSLKTTKPTTTRCIADDDGGDDGAAKRGSSSPRPKEKSQRMTRSSSRRGLMPSSGRSSSQRNLMGSPKRSSSQRNLMSSPKRSSSQRGLTRTSDNRQSSSTSDLTALRNKKKNPNPPDLRSLMLSSPEAQKKRSVVAPYSPQDRDDDSSDEEEDEVGRAQAALKLVVNHHGSANKNDTLSQQELEQNLSLLASPKAQQPSLEDSLASLASTNTAPAGDTSPKCPTRTKLLGSDDEKDHSPTTPNAQKRNRRRRDRNEQQPAVEGGSTAETENQPLTKKERIDEICKKPDNQFCSECNTTPKPIWAFFLTCPIDGKRLAGLCCDACYNIFINLGEGDITHKSTKTVALWADEDMEALDFCGNKMINAIYEAKLEGEKEESYKLEHGREAFFFEKYINFRFLSGRIYKDVMAQKKKEAEKKEREKVREKKFAERLNSRRNLVEADTKAGDDEKVMKRRGSRRNLMSRPEDSGEGGMKRSSSTPGLVSSGIKSGDPKEGEKVMKRRNSRRNLMDRPEGSGRMQRSSSQRKLSTERGEESGRMQRSSSQRRLSTESGEERRIKKSSSGPSLSSVVTPRSKPVDLSSPDNPMSKPGLASDMKGGQRHMNQSSSPNLTALRASLSRPGLTSAALSPPPTKGGNATFARQSRSGSNLSAMLQSVKKSPSKGTLLDEFIAQRRKDCSDRNSFAQNLSPSSMNNNGQSGAAASQKWNQLINSVKGNDWAAGAPQNG